MAISGSDGSIILTTKVDETGLKKGLVSLKKLGATAGKAFLAIGAAAATATVAITKMAVSAYADGDKIPGSSTFHADLYTQSLQVSCLF